MRVIPIEVTAIDCNNLTMHCKSEFQPNNTLQEVEDWVERETRGKEVIRVEVFHNREGTLVYYCEPVVTQMVQFLESLQLSCSDDIKRDEILAKFWEVEYET